MEKSAPPRRCANCTGPECIAWDYIAWDCCRITGATCLVERSELMAAVALGKSQALGNLSEKDAAPSADDTESGKETQHDR